MKLIEKLADDEYRDFVGNEPTIAAIIVEKLAKRFYEVGFRKAREMAKEASYHTSDCDRRCSSDCNIQIGDRIAELGEEEV